MAVEQHGVAVARAHALDLRGEQRVIGLEIPLRRAATSARVGRAAGDVDRLVGERARRAQFGVVGARVQRRAATDRD